ncbi:MAG: DJ-1/PfpI family protein [Spirochaetaceae bacterium]|jgi:4-methyl-5(b-hydroxyethyl)-thiazole monophosphate biosynthesis|nr:DJ-1/PfpI family protein [Spirochaetaceae bacterium]
MSHKMYLFLADGFEEVEALTPADYLRRAGIDVKLVSISGNKTVTGANNIQVSADILIGDVPPLSSEDGIILPGGGQGAVNLAASTSFDALLKKSIASSALICAICAAPAIVLASKGILDGRKWTCYPGLEKDAGKAKETWLADRVVVDGNIISSRAPGTAAEWSIKIIEKLLGAKAASKVAGDVLLPVV